MQWMNIVWQAFKNYDEAGAVRRIQCLKYLVLATMLMESDVDPFDAQVELCPCLRVYSEGRLLCHTQMPPVVLSCPMCNIDRVSFPVLTSSC